MAQYTILDVTGDDTLELTDGQDTFRIQARGVTLYFEQNVSGLGWVTISEISAPTGAGEFRLGARNAAWRIDQSVNGGFAGTEDTDWMNVEAHSL